MKNEAPRFLQNLEKYMPGPNSKYIKKPMGFWQGFLHGIILPLTFIYKQYQPRVKLYETDNLERGYNLGFVLGIIGLIGALSSST